MLPATFYNDWGAWNWKAHLAVWGTLAALLGGLFGGLFAAGVLSGADFSCPRGQHAYIETWIPVVIPVGKTTTVILEPVMGCET